MHAMRSKRPSELNKRRSDTSEEANEQEANLAAQYFHPESLIEVFFVAMQRQKDTKRSLI